MAGRINLTSIEGGKGEVGYRIGEKYQGQGYATGALALLADIGFGEYGLSLLEAGTSAENIGSQKVLGKNGFLRTGLEKGVMKVNGQWVDGYLYTRSAEE